MKINILLPHKEKFDLYKSSSVSNTIKNNFNLSRYKKHIRIFGQQVEFPIFKDNFLGIKNPSFFFKSKNINLANEMCEIILKDTDKEQIVEMHNRPYLVDNIYKKLKNVPICLFFHNDPKEMKGSKTIKERENLINKVQVIFCVSEYIKKQFLYGIKIKITNVFVLYNGVERLLKKIPEKKKEVLFIGRLVHEKGVHLYVEAVSQIATKYPKWKFSIVGSTHLGSSEKKSKFAINLSNKFINIGKNTNVTGFLNYTNVQKKMQEASIIVIPSIWEEPFGLVVAEAMSNGIALIASEVGGIPEIIGSNGIIIKDINSEKVKIAILNYLNDEIKLKKYQTKSWDNFKFSSSRSSKILDSYRDVIFKSFY